MLARRAGAFGLRATPPARAGSMATVAAAAPPPWSVRLIAGLDAADARATSLASPLTLAQLNWRPSPAEWSVGQCLDHLTVANDVYLPAIADSLQGPASEVQEIAPGWFGRWFIRNYIEPSATTKRAAAPKKIVPHTQVDAGILRRFLDTNQQARDLIRRAEKYDVNRIRFKNPFLPLLRFTVGTGFEILTKHQQRHLLQAERIRASPGFPQAGSEAQSSPATT